jgi:hypothetical protein
LPLLAPHSLDTNLANKCSKLGGTQEPKSPRAIESESPRAQSNSKYFARAKENSSTSRLFGKSRPKAGCEILAENVPKNRLRLLFKLFEVIGKNSI